MEPGQSAELVSVAIPFRCDIFHFFRISCPYLSEQVEHRRIIYIVMSHPCCRIGIDPDLGTRYIYGSGSFVGYCYIVMCCIFKCYLSVVAGYYRVFLAFVLMHGICDHFV